MLHGAPANHKATILEIQGSWGRFLSLPKDSPVARALAEYMPRQRWYRDKTRAQKSVWIEDVIPLAPAIHLLMVRVEFVVGEPSDYCVPISFRENECEPSITIAEVRATDGFGFVTDATGDAELWVALLSVFEAGGRAQGHSTEIVGWQTPLPKFGLADASPVGRLLGADQTNTSYVYDERFVLKLLRKLEPGQSQEIEVLKQLGKTSFAHVPRLLGYLEVRGLRSVAGSLGIIQEFVANQGDVWQLALDAVSDFHRRAASLARAPAFSRAKPLEISGCGEPPETEELLGAFAFQMDLLGQRTAELHIALAASDEPEFRQVPYDAPSTRDFYQSLRKLAKRAFTAIRASENSLTEEDREVTQALLRRERALLARLFRIRDCSLSGSRIRVHGDLHLGQVLYTGRDFVFVDFEGEPARSPSQRREKRSPLADVAGMLRSFHYAACSVSAALYGDSVREEERKLIQDVFEFWQDRIGARYLRGYLRTVARAKLLPEESEALKLLLDAYLMEKALYEVVYELENRPAWVGIPLRALLSLAG